VGVQAKHKQWDEVLSKVASMAAAGQKSRKRLADLARAKNAGAELTTEYQVRSLLTLSFFSDEPACVNVRVWSTGGKTQRRRAGGLDRRRWRAC
jgi:hypothetical protein